MLLNFPAERAVFLKEYASNTYRVSSYYFGRSAIEIPIVVIVPILFSLISYYIVGLNDHNVGKLFIFTLMNILVALAGNAIGLLAGSAFSDPKVASSVAPLFIMPLMLFSGLYVNADSMGDYIAWT